MGVHCTLGSSVLSPAIAKRAAVCIGICNSGWVAESGTSVRNLHQSSSSTESRREDSEDELAEIAGAHYPYIFEPEDTSSDHSESSNKDIEAEEEDRLNDTSW